MSAITERIEALETEQKERSDEYHKARLALAETTANIVRLEILKFAEAYPSITSVGIEANFESDDEGGVFYSAHLDLFVGEGENVDDFEWPEDAPLTEDDLFDAANDLDEDSAALVFGASGDVEVSIADLRTAAGL